ncbi:hypothetical protein FT231_22035 [Escherichia coli]|nr:hypothetical protein [Escherichia coli]
MITVGIAVAGFPAMSTPVFMVSVCFSVKIKGRDDGTINNHDESHLFGPDEGNDSNLLIVFYVQIMPDDFVMQLHRF